MYVQAIKKIEGSIFPILFSVKQGELTSIGVSGTGFFIDDKGHFLTAHHVVTEVPQGSKLIYVGNLPNKFTQPIEIKEIFSDPVKDIYLGKIDSEFLPPVEMVFEKPEVGKSVCLCGYPMAQLVLTPEGTINVDNVRKYWQPTFVIDYAKANHNGRAYDGYMTQHTSLKGMSGGPVFDTDGKVSGIDVAALTREIPDNQTPTIVTNALIVGLDTIKDIIDKIN